MGHERHKYYFYYYDDDDCALGQLMMVILKIISLDHHLQCVDGIYPLGLILKIESVKNDC